MRIAILACAWSAPVAFGLPFAQQPVVPPKHLTVRPPEAGSFEPGGVLFGQQVCAIGDLDGDGARDWAVSAAHAQRSYKKLGAVLAISSRTHRVLARIDGDFGHTEFGSLLAPAQDVDGDGTDDLVCGEIEWHWPMRSARNIRILSGKDLCVIRQWSPFESYISTSSPPGAPSTNEVVLYSNARRQLSRFGARSPTATTLDVETFQWIIGVRDDQNRPTRHLLGLLRVDPDTWVSTTIDEIGWTVPLEIPWRAFDDRAYEVTALRLRWGDEEVIVTAVPSWNRLAGAVFVHSPTTGEVLRELTVFAAENRNNFGIEFGHALIAVPDLDGDGSPDVVVGGPGDEFGGVITWSPRTGKTIWKNVGEFIGNVGTSIALLDDVDGDGVLDVLVGGGKSQIGASPYRNGSVRVLSGKDGSLLDILLETEVPELSAR